MYDDDYATCRDTFAALRIFSDPNRPEIVTTQRLIVSKDVRRHVDHLLGLIDTDAELRRRIREDRADISCFWASAHGHGGPTLSPDQMSRLAEYNLEIWFDFYGEITERVA